MRRQKELEPLLVPGNGSFDFNPKGKVLHGGMIIPEEKIEIDDDFEEEILVTERKRKRRVSLIWQDFLLLTLEFLQFFAVLLLYVSEVDLASVPSIPSLLHLPFQP